MEGRALWKVGCGVRWELGGLCGAVSADRGRRMGCGMKARTDMEAREPGEGRGGAPWRTEWRSGAVLGLAEASDTGRETPNEFSPGRYGVRERERRWARGRPRDLRRGSLNRTGRSTFEMRDWLSSGLAGRPIRQPDGVRANMAIANWGVTRVTKYQRRGRRDVDSGAALAEGARFGQSRAAHGSAGGRAAGGGRCWSESSARWPVVRVQCQSGEEEKTGQAMARMAGAVGVSVPAILRRTRVARLCLSESHRGSEGAGRVQKTLSQTGPACTGWWDPGGSLVHTAAQNQNVFSAVESYTCPFADTRCCFLTGNVSLNTRPAAPAPAHGTSTLRLHFFLLRRVHSPHSLSSHLSRGRRNASPLPVPSPLQDLH